MTDTSHLGKVTDKSVLVVGGSIIFWLFASSVNQETPYENCAAVLLLAMFAYVALVALPRLLGQSYVPTMYQAILRASRVITALSIVLLIVPISPAFDQGSRLQGVTLDPAVSSQAFLVAALIFLIEWFRSGQGMGAFIWFISAASLDVLTRSRGAIGALAISCVFLIVLVRGSRKQLKRIIASAMVIVLVVSGVAVWASTAESSRNDVLAFLRLSSGDVFDTRESHWQDGLQRISSAKLFGLGILSKFSSHGSVASQLESGTTGYDVSMDPHNAFINIGQASGYPSIVLLAILLALLVIKCGRSVILHRPRQSDELIFCNWIVITCCVMSVVSPAFLSFGSLPDRLFYLCAGSTLAKSSAGTLRMRWESKVVRSLPVIKTPPANNIERQET
jgi:hypothetical protein